MTFYPRIGYCRAGSVFSSQVGYLVTFFGVVWGIFILGESHSVFVWISLILCRIGFPELVTPLIFQLKDFLKRCKQGNYCKKIKQILDKVEGKQNMYIVQYTHYSLYKMHFRNNRCYNYGGRIREI